jgi:hypothetical protein
MSPLIMPRMSKPYKSLPNISRTALDVAAKKRRSSSRDAELAFGSINELDLRSRSIRKA